MSDFKHAAKYEHDLMTITDTEEAPSPSTTGECVEAEVRRALAEWEDISEGKHYCDAEWEGVVDGVHWKLTAWISGAASDLILYVGTADYSRLRSIGYADLDEWFGSTIYEITR